NDKDRGLDDEGHGLDDEGHGLEGEGLGLEEEEAAPEGQQQAVLVVDTAFRFMPEQQGADRVSAFRHPTLTTWVDPKDDKVYTDIPVYPPLAHVQTPLSPEWSSGSFPISPSSSVVPSPIASPVATPTATISINEDQSLEHQQERTVMTFISLWRPMLVFEAWAGNFDTRMTDMSRAGYDDHRLIFDMLVQQAALQHELREMRDRVTALEQERDHREQ
ncbi:hypothetical protein Tco_0303204, partial [Tanacetum coccineum]